MLQLKGQKSYRAKSVLSGAEGQPAKQIRNSKHEIRNKPQPNKSKPLRNSKTTNPNQVCLEHSWCFFSSHLNLFRVSKFGFGASNFDHLKLFRISDFVLRIFVLGGLVSSVRRCGERFPSDTPRTRRSKCREASAGRS